MLRRLITAAVLAVLFLPASGWTQPATPRIFYIQPMGHVVSKADLGYVRESLAAFFDATVRVLPPIEMPGESYVRARRRYRAEVILEELQGLLPADGCRILGLTADDICAQKDGVSDWGVIGLACMEERSCVVSSRRCRSGAGAARCRTRLGKIAVHEMAHTYGLSHCAETGCLMEDADGTVTTVDGEYDICPHCRDILDRTGNPIPAGPEIPWPRPGGLPAPERAAAAGGARSAS